MSDKLIEKLDEMRRAAFDKWNWETGDPEDKLEFEKIGKIIEQLQREKKQSARFIYKFDINSVAHDGTIQINHCLNSTCIIADLYDDQGLTMMPCAMTYTNPNVIIMNVSNHMPIFGLWSVEIMTVD